MTFQMSYNQGVSNIISSPCELLSPFVSDKLIYTKCQDYERVRKIIHDKLSCIQELTFIYKHQYQAFLCRFSHGDSFRSQEIDCYWDPKNQDHVIDVRRTGSGGFYKFDTDLFEELKAAFSEAGTTI